MHRRCREAGGCRGGEKNTTARHAASFLPHAARITDASASDRRPRQPFTPSAAYTLTPPSLEARSSAALLVTCGSIVAEH